MDLISVTRQDGTIFVSSREVPVPPSGPAGEAPADWEARIPIGSAIDLRAVKRVVNGNDWVISELARINPPHANWGFSLPSFSIIVPCHPGDRPSEGLRALGTLSYPADKLELIMVKGTHPSVQRNVAAALSRADLLAFMDDDCVPDPDWLANSVGYFDNPEVAIVGGPNLTPTTDPPMARRIGLACSSRWGTASMRSRYAESRERGNASEANLVLSNLICRRSIFEDGVKFSPMLFPNEENHLMNQVERQGKKMVYSPEVVVFHPRKRDLVSFARQFMGYGVGRGNQSRIDPRSLRALHLIPSALAASLVGLPLSAAFGASLVAGFFALVLALYLAMTLIVSAQISLREREPSLIAYLPLIFVTLHLAYGTGFIKSFLRPGHRNAEVDPDSLCTEALSIRMG